jgi:succinyl-diaminopimelate desuccinylase
MELEKLVDGFKDELVKSVQEIIRIKSVEDEERPGMPFGEGVNEALEYALNLSRKLGFSTKNFNGYAGHAEFGEGEKTIGILVHLDVVPEGDGWTYPPYGAEIHDGRIYGRGAIDDKGPAIAALYGMKAIMESGLPIKNKIRIIFGTNEESSWKGIKYYLKKVKAPDIAFTPDADFPVINGEKGILEIDLKKTFTRKYGGDIVIKSINGGNRPNMIPDLCKSIIEIKNNREHIVSLINEFVHKTGYEIGMRDKGNEIILISRGVSAHGSTPEKGKNAISQLVELLGYISSGNCDINRFVRFYNKKIGNQYNGESIGCGFRDEISGKLTFNVGVIQLDQKEVKLSIDIRYPIRFNKEDIINGIKSEIYEDGFELIEKDHLEPIYIPRDNFLVKKLMDVYIEITGEDNAEPIIIGGGTYARAMKNAVAFGPLMTGQEDLAHQKDEYISIEHLITITKIYAKALYELAK